jgi:hypothetical protein
MAGGRGFLDRGNMFQVHHQWEAKPMELFLWILGCLCGLCFLWLTVMNWIIFWKRHILGMEAPSWFPLLAGILGVIAVLLLPLNLSCFWWLPLLIDWGSAPGILYSIWWHVVRKPPE